MKSGVPKWLKWGVALGLTLAAVIFYAIFDPGNSVWMPQCMVHRFTGYDCPGCGSQRMLHALLHGRIGEAWHYNAFLLCMIPALGLMGFSEIKRRRYPRLYRILYSMPMIYTLCGAIVLWTIIRNL